MVKANKKSTSAVSMALMGMINLGKYIFLMMLALLTILLALFISPLLKMFQINKQKKKNIWITPMIKAAEHIKERQAAKK